MSKTKEFIKKARAKHGGRYDYSKTEYISSRGRVIITCPEHGDFEQTASSHLKPYGCIRCGNKTSTKEIFVKRAIEAHGDQYNYSKVKYTNQMSHVTIVCRLHGEFKQKPYYHLRGNGCPNCGSIKSLENRRRTTESFIKEASGIFAGYYDYSKTKYLKADARVIIICPKHGEFEQRARDHLNSRGCSRCSGFRNNTEGFIKKAETMHGDAYDYSKVEYVDCSTAVIITCKEHGDFEQRATNHLQGKGCPQCGGSNLITTKEFIKRSSAKHAGKYDYSKSKYKNNEGKVTIICPDHGEFKQRATNHLMGAGCSLCPAIYRYDEPTSVYLMSNGKQVKVGYSIEPELRLSDLNKVQPFTADLLLTWVLPDMPTARAAEINIHRELASYRSGLTGFDGATEWFDITPLHAATTISNIIKQYR